MSRQAMRPCCCAFLDPVRLPVLRQHKPAAVLVMDTRPAHKAKAARELLDRSKVRDRSLPSCSPDLCPQGTRSGKPIAPAWAKMKSRLRKTAARTADARHEALGPALDASTPQDAQWTCFGKVESL